MNKKTLMNDTSLYRSWHLGGNEHNAITTEFEWSLLRFHEAFQRYCLQIGSTAGLGNLTYQELIILNVIRMQDRPKPVTIIARLLNRDDIPNIQYSLRKLVSLELISKDKESNSKIYNYSMTEAGRVKINRYAELRESLLTTQTSSIDRVDEKMAEAAKLISLLTGIYDEAGRIAATYASPLEDDE